MADIWVGVNGADEALRQVNAEMLGGARALADQAGATVVAIVWGASAAGHAKALASWGADRVVIVESEAAPAPEAVARTLARLAAGLTQQQLADRVRVSARTIISIEREQYSPSLLLAYRLAREFRTSVEELCCLEENLQKEEARYETLE